MWKCIRCNKDNEDLVENCIECGHGKTMNYIEYRTVSKVQDDVQLNWKRKRQEYLQETNTDEVGFNSVMELLNSVTELFVWKTDVSEVNEVIDMISLLKMPVTLDNKPLLDNAKEKFEALNEGYKKQLPELAAYLTLLNDQFNGSLVYGRMLSRTWTISKNDFAEFHKYDMGTFYICLENGNTLIGIPLLGFSKDNKHFSIYAIQKDYDNYTVYCERLINGKLYAIVDDEERDLAQMVVERNLEILSECSFKRNFDSSTDAIKMVLNQMKDMD